MIRKLISGIAVAVGLSVFPAAVQAANFFTPTQAQLNSFVFVDYWAGNGAALNSTTLVGADGVQYNFNTGFSTSTPDSFSRSQWTLPFTQDLTGYSNIGVAFQVPTGGSVMGNQLEAQVDVHYTGGQDLGTWTPINTTGRTNVYTSLGTIPAASLNQLTSIDIELRSNGDPYDGSGTFGPIDVGDKVNAFSAPAPPSFIDGYQISDFEGTDPGTWGPAFQPDHVHTIVAADATPFNNGVTKGTHALKITRTRTDQPFPAASTNKNFRWGSQMALNANLPGATGDYNNNGSVDAADYTVWRDHLNSSFTLPNRATANTGNVSQADYTSWKNNFGHTGGGTDPAIQTKINTLVDAINNAATTGRIALDVSLLDDVPDQFPNNNPTFMGYELFITDGSAAFFQSNLGFPNFPAFGASYNGVTLSVPINSFVDQNGSGTLGIAGLLLKKNSTFTIGLSTNVGTGGVAEAEDHGMYSVTFNIDNIRVQTLAPGGAGAAAAVPEPSTAFLALLGLVGGLIGCRRRM